MVNPRNSIPVGDAIPPLSYEEACRRASERFRLPFGSQEALDQTTQWALERFRKRFEQPLYLETSAVDQILLPREFLKVACGVTFLEPGVRALAAAYRRPMEMARLESLVEELLTPREDAADPGGYLDPLAWDVSRVPASEEEGTALRLTLFVKAMLDQEDGANQGAGLSVRKAVEIAVAERCVRGVRIGPDHGVLKERAGGSEILLFPFTGPSGGRRKWLARQVKRCGDAILGRTSEDHGVVRRADPAREDTRPRPEAAAHAARPSGDD